MHVRTPLRVAAVVALAACQPGSSGDAGRLDDGSGPGVEVAAQDDSLRLTLQAPAEVDAGEPVLITLRVENVSDRSVDLYLTGRPVAFDLIVTGLSGEVVWRRLADAVIPAILQIRTLAPGQGLEFEDSWDQRSGAGELVPPGDYTVRGEILAEDEPLAAPPKTLHIREP